MLSRLAAPAFILLWSTGFTGSKLGTPYAEPATFLAIRFVLVCMLLGALIAGAAFIGRARTWPRGAAIGHALLVGILMHGCYLGGVFWAIDRGMPAGTAALIVCLQPLLTAALAGGVLGERVTALQWLGLGLGLAGVGVVLAPDAVAAVVLSTGIGDMGSAPQLPAGDGDGGALNLEAMLAFDPAPVAATLIALAAITVATLYQKRFGGGMDPMAGAFVQYVGALVVCMVYAAAFETGEVVWSTEFIVALLWLSAVLSIGAIGLLMYLIETSDVSRVAALFYLVPVFTALQGWLFFDERLSIVQAMGAVVVVAALALARPAQRA